MWYLFVALNQKHFAPATFKHNIVAYFVCHWSNHLFGRIMNVNEHPLKKKNLYTSWFSEALWNTNSAHKFWRLHRSSINWYLYKFVRRHTVKPSSPNHSWAPLRFVFIVLNCSILTFYLLIVRLKCVSIHRPIGHGSYIILARHDKHRSLRVCMPFGRFDSFEIQCHAFFHSLVQWFNMENIFIFVRFRNRRPGISWRRWKTSARLTIKLSQ